MTSTTKIRLSAIIFSLLLSLLAFVTDDIINHDGIIYIHVAYTYYNEGIKSISQFYNWPFFSILIAYTHKITSLSFEHSAYLLNSLLFAIFINAFLQISDKILANSRQLAIAAVLILCFSTLNEYRSFIIRDIGYWAFCCLALYQFLVFDEKPTLQNASLWQIYTIIAILFRIEGVVILLSLPIYLFFKTDFKSALKQNIQLYFLFIFGFILIVAKSFSKSSLLEAFSRWELLNHHLSIDKHSANFHHKLEILNQHILHKLSHEYDVLILISGLLAMLLYKLFKGFSFSYFVLYLISRQGVSSQAKTPHFYLLCFFIVSNILVLISFVITEYFISTRYGVMALIGLLLLTLPRLCAGIEYYWLSRNKKMLTLIGALLIISLIDSSTSTNSKFYIKDAAHWASKNIPENSRVVSDNDFIEYYFNSHQPSATLIRDTITSFGKYDYLIVVEKQHKQRNVNLTNLPIKLIYSSSNKRNDTASVYQLIPEK